MWNKRDWQLFGTWFLIGAPAAAAIGAGLAITANPPQAILTVQTRETEVTRMPKHALTEVPSTIAPPSRNSEPTAVETFTTDPVVATTEPVVTSDPVATSEHGGVLEIDLQPIYEQLVREFIDRDPLGSTFIEVPSSD